MPTGFKQFEAGCPGLPARGFAFDESGCNVIAVPCDDTTHAGQQNFSWSQWVANTATDGNTRTSWGYISADGEMYSLVGTATCGGGNMNYNDTCCQINHYTDDGATLTKLLVVNPVSTIPATNCRPGQSDEPCYYPGQNGSTAYEHFIYPVLGTSLIADPLSTSGWVMRAWCKRDDFLFAGVHNVGLSDLRICEHNAHDTTVPAPRTRTNAELVGVATEWIALSATADYLYAMYYATSTANVKIAKISRATYLIEGTINLTGISDGAVVGMHAHADNTIYLFAQTNTRWAVYYWNGTTLIYVGHAPRFTAMPFGGTSMHFRGRSLYFGARGFGGFSPAVFKMDFPCDSGASLFASLTAGATSVPRGGTITATWADVLVPRATDRIYVRSAPTTSHDPGFTGTIHVNHSSGMGAGSGSVSVAIPGGLTPGNYILQYASENAIYVARSANFEVT